MHGLPDPAEITPGNEWSVYSDQQTQKPEKAGATLIFHVYCHSTVPPSEYPVDVSLGTYVTRDFDHPEIQTGLVAEDYWPNYNGYIKSGVVTNFDGRVNLNLLTDQLHDWYMRTYPPNQIDCYTAAVQAPAGCTLKGFYCDWNGRWVQMVNPGNNHFTNLNPRPFYFDFKVVMFDCGFYHVFAASMMDASVRAKARPNVAWSTISADWQTSEPYIPTQYANPVYDSHESHASGRYILLSYINVPATKVETLTLRNINPTHKLMNVPIAYQVSRYTATPTISSCIEYDTSKHSSQTYFSDDMYGNQFISCEYDAGTKTVTSHVLSGWSTSTSMTSARPIPPTDRNGSTTYEGVVLLYKRCDFQLSTSLNYPYGGRVLDNSISGKHPASFWWMENQNLAFEDGASVSCIPNEGYTFCYWKDNHGNTYDQQNFSFLLSDDTSLTAYISCEGLLYSVENDHLIHGTHDFNNGLLYADELL